MTGLISRRLSASSAILAVAAISVFSLRGLSPGDPRTLIFSRWPVMDLIAERLEPTVALCAP